MKTGHEKGDDFTVNFLVTDFKTLTHCIYHQIADLRAQAELVPQQQQAAELPAIDEKIFRLEQINESIFGGFFNSLPQVERVNQAERVK